MRRSKGKRRHAVTLCRHANPTRGKRSDGRGSRSIALFAFSWADVAELLGLKIQTVQKLAKKGAFQVTDLESLFRYFQKRRPQEAPSVEAPPVDPASLN